MAIGSQIRHYRNKLTWTLDYLSEKSGVDTGTISALEVRDSDRSKFFAAIAKAFGLTLEQLADASIDYDVFPANSKTVVRFLPEETNPTSAIRTMESTPSDRQNVFYDIWTLETIKIMMGLKDDDKRGAVANLKTYVHNLSPPAEQSSPAKTENTGTHH